MESKKRVIAYSKFFVYSLLFLLLLGLVSGCNDRKKQTAEASGVIVEIGYETKRKSRKNRNRQSSSSRRVLSVVYQYDVNGVNYENEKEETVVSTFSKYSIGKRGKVCYDPADPNNAEFYLEDYVCGQ